MRPAATAASISPCTSATSASIIVCGSTPLAWATLAIDLPAFNSPHSVRPSIPIRLAAVSNISASHSCRFPSFFNALAVSLTKCVKYSTNPADFCPASSGEMRPAATAASISACTSATSASIIVCGSTPLAWATEAIELPALISAHSLRTSIPINAATVSIPSSSSSDFSSRTQSERTSSLSASLSTFAEHSSGGVARCAPICCQLTPTSAAIKANITTILVTLNFAFLFITVSPRESCGFI